MTIWNEAVRLFFAVSALILVGMLSAPMGGNMALKTEKTREISFKEPDKIQPLKSKDSLKMTDRKPARKATVKKS